MCVTKKSQYVCHKKNRNKCVTKKLQYVCQKKIAICVSQKKSQYVCHKKIAISVSQKKIAICVSQKKIAISVSQKKSQYVCHKKNRNMCVTKKIAISVSQEIWMAFLVEELFFERLQTNEFIFLLQIVNVSRQQKNKHFLTSIQSESKLAEKTARNGKKRIQFRARNLPKNFYAFFFLTTE